MVCELSWRAEEACRGAWPSPRESVIDGWLLRAVGGEIRRTNSVNPLRGGRGDLRGVMAETEAVYGALGQAALFRLPTLVEGRDDILEAAGYVAEGRTLTLCADLGKPCPEAQGGVTVSPEAGRAWLLARARLGGVSAANQAIYETMLQHIVAPKAFASTHHEGEIAALAYGVVHDGMAVIESVVTDLALRRRGHGRRVVGRLLHWAQSAGAEAACLQVVAANAPAVALYRGLGFTRELYRYRYFRKMAG